mmetsp:Transcript_9218/g.23343  ORF Transcript_9218/g.23343 Transcript_9218/m.23343 type:complete len:89 (-) Transcript_9218:106-372(-)
MCWYTSFVPRKELETKAIDRHRIKKYPPATKTTPEYNASSKSLSTTYFTLIHSHSHYPSVDRNEEYTDTNRTHLGNDSTSPQHSTPKI